MKQIASVLTIALSFLMLASCSRKETPKSQVTPEDVKRDTQKAMQTTEAYAQRQKEEYQKKAEAELNELDHRIDELKAKTEKAGAKAKAAMDQQMAELRKQQEVARQKLEELKGASTSTWEETRKKLDAAIEELKRRYDRVVSRPKP